MSFTFKFRDQVHTVELENGKQTEVVIGGKKLRADFQRIDEKFYSITIDRQSLGVAILRKGKKVEVFLDGELYEFESISGIEKRSGSVLLSGTQEIKAPMPSRVVKVLKGQDEDVKEGEGVIVIEAMKMESELKSPIDGKVKEVKVEEGTVVESGKVLVVVVSPE